MRIPEQSGTRACFPLLSLVLGGLAIGSLVVPCGVSCASTPAPTGRLAGASTELRKARGGYTSVALRDGRIYEGELIAVDIARDAMYVLLESANDAKGRALPMVPRLVSLRAALIDHARLAEYDDYGDAFGAWTALGALSTVSHGMYLVLSLPIWTVAGSVASYFQSRAPLHDFPSPETLENFRAYARFPQGLPPDVREAQVLYGRRGSGTRR